MTKTSNLKITTKSGGEDRKTFLDSFSARLFLHQIYGTFTLSLESCTYRQQATSAGGKEGIIIEPTQLCRFVHHAAAFPKTYHYYYYSVLNKP